MFGGVCFEKALQGHHMFFSLEVAVVVLATLSEINGVQ